jgi:hypothetical protein
MGVVSWLFVAFGALIWFGGWRSWAHSGDALRSWMLGAPWLGLCFLLLQVALFLRWLGVAVPPDAVPWLAGVPAIIAVCVGTFGWPDWAKPPWYRRLEALEREVRDREGPNAHLW